MAAIRPSQLIALAPIEAARESVSYVLIQYSFGLGLRDPAILREGQARAGRSAPGVWAQSRLNRHSPDSCRVVRYLPGSVF